MKFYYIIVFLSLCCIILSQEIGVEIMPSSHYIINKQDLQRLKQEINHDLRKRISDIEESWQANEAIRQVSSGVWNLQASPLTQPAYPGFFPVNGVGQIGEQALKTYWENFAKSSDPDYNKRQATAKIETKHSETLTDKLKDQMNKANSQIQSLKNSIKKSTDSAKSESSTTNPNMFEMEKNNAEIPSNVDKEEDRIKKNTDITKKSPSNVEKIAFKELNNLKNFNLNDKKQIKMEYRKDKTNFEKKEKKESQRNGPLKRNTFKK